MTFTKYKMALEGDLNGLKYFDGTKARKSIVKILGSYEPDDSLTSRLIDWAELITHRGVADWVNTQKWKFNYINE
jgi:hypothetical protein